MSVTTGASVLGVVLVVAACVNGTVDGVVDAAVVGALVAVPKPMHDVTHNATSAAVAATRTGAGTALADLGARITLHGNAADVVRDVSTGRWRALERRGPPAVVIGRAT
jgi:hypothetical protein